MELSLWASAAPSQAGLRSIWWKGPIPWEADGLPGAAHDPASRLPEAFDRRRPRRRRYLHVRHELGPAQDLARPGLPAGVADQRLRLLHRLALARPAEGRRAGRQDHAAAGLARGGRSL